MGMMLVEGYHVIKLKVASAIRRGVEEAEEA
jgi:hypothetical protein